MLFFINEFISEFISEFINIKIIKQTNYSSFFLKLTFLLLPILRVLLHINQFHKFCRLAQQPNVQNNLYVLNMSVQPI